MILLVLNEKSGFTRPGKKKIKRLKFLERESINLLVKV